MKKLPLLNREISAAIAGLGHRDLLVVVDAGHAIPRNADRIDIALRPGIPSMIDVLATILTEMRAGVYIVCNEMETDNAGLLAELEALMPDVERSEVDYGQFRTLVESAKTVIRTGECSAYANVILRATGTT